MKTIHIRTKVESDTFHLPELRGLIGRRSRSSSGRQVAGRSETSSTPNLPGPPDEGHAARRRRFRRVAGRPRGFEAYWPHLEHLIARDSPVAARGRASAAPQAPRTREEGGTTFDGPTRAAGDRSGRERSGAMILVDTAS